MTTNTALRWGNETRPVAHLSGEIDLANAANLFAAIKATTNGTGVVDLSDVTFVDSSALNQLVQLHKSIELHIVAPPGTRPRRVLELAGLVDVLQIHDELNTALGDP